MPSKFKRLGGWHSSKWQIGVAQINISTAWATLISDFTEFCQKVKMKKEKLIALAYGIFILLHSE